MNHIDFRKYRDDDNELIQDFFQESYALKGVDYSWMIDRWNFTRSVSRCMNSLSLDEWESRVLVGEEKGNIVAVVNSEGENCGEAFFQLIRDHYPKEAIKEMFDFTEEKLRVTKDGKTYVELRLMESLTDFVEEALKRGFKKVQWSEPLSMKTLDDQLDLSYRLPKGYSFTSGSKLTGDQRAILHREAFGYQADPVLAKGCAIGFKSMEIQPYYNKDLDLVVLNKKGMPVAFANVWHDPLNHIAILEPVGTHRNYRKMGLAKAAIFEGLKRSMELGSTKGYVGSDQDFYKAIGFEVISQLQVYRKEFDS